MRIGIDARVLQTGLVNKGIGTYAYNLIKNLIHIRTGHKFVFYIFKNEPIPHLLIKDKGQVSDITVDFELIRLQRHKRLNFIWQQFNIFKGNTDLFHSLLSLGPSHEIVLPYLQTQKTIATIHDLIPYHLQDDWSRYIKDTRDYRIQIKALKKVEKIIAISSYVKNDIISTFSIPEQKIRVVYPGVSEEFKPIKDKAKCFTVKEKYNLPEKFILAVGDDYKKNIPTIFNVMRILNKLSLVIIGKPTEELKVKSLDLKERVIFTGYIPQEDLVIIYNLAELLLFPSIAEGFGLPVIEAMACKCPVISSNAWALPEVVGNGGLTFSPYDVNGMVHSIRRVMNDSHFRADIINRGYEQARKFTWRKCAEETMEVYEEVLRKR